MRAPLVALALALSAPAWAGRGAGAALPELPAAFAVPDAAAPAAAGGPWWESFDDPGLARVMQEGLDANYDLRAAADRIRLSDAAAMQALAPLLPQVGFSYSLSGEPDEVRAGRLGFLPEDALPGFVYSGSGSVSANLGLDLFGRSVLGYQASRDDLAASEEDRAELAMAVAQRIASAWFDVGFHAERIAMLQTQVQANREVLELTELAFDRGEGTGVNVLQQKQQLAATEAQLPLARMALRVAKQQLAILLGRTPDDLPGVLPEDLPSLPPRPSLGSPTSLLDARPDLRAQAERVDAAWRRRLAAERSFLPTLSVGVSGQLQYGNAQDISFGLEPEVAYDSFYGWGVSAAVNIPIFDGGQTIARLRQARATESSAVHQLGAASLSALAEVEGAAVQEEEQLLRLDAVRAQAAAAKDAYEASKARYADGVGDYLTVLTSLGAWQTAELGALSAERDVLAARISLHDALGGTWTHDLARDSSRGGAR